MNCKIIGIKKVDYTNKQGRQVNGTELHVSYPDNKVDGQAVDKFYISSMVNDCTSAKIGKNVNILFNQYGKVDFLQFAE